MVALSPRVWAMIVVVGACTVALKGAGPVLLGGRPLPPRLGRLVQLLAPTLLAALIATQTLTRGQAIVADARIAGLAAAGVCLLFRLPTLVVVVAAAASTAAVRALS